jgi:hypothetical protein
MSKKVLLSKQNNNLSNPLIRNFLKFLSDTQWLLIGLVWIITYLFCLWGVYKQILATGEVRSFWDPFYRTFQLFLFDDSMIISGKLLSWELEIGRFLAPMVAAYTVFSAIFELYKEQIKMFRIKKVSNHIVICGIGRKGLELIRDFLANGFSVVVIEIDDNNDNISICRESGAFVIIGNATDNEILMQARVQLADKVIAITGNDGANVEIAVKTYHLIKNRKEKIQHTVQCSVQVVNAKLRLLFDKHPVFTDVYDDFEITIFNTYTNSARLLFNRFPIDKKGISKNDIKEIHLIIVGFGQMGESVLLQAARIGHYANRKKIKITVVDRTADKKAKILQGHYPQLTSICDIEFITAEAEDPFILNYISKECKAEITETTIIIAMDNDAIALSCALIYMQKIDDNEIPVIVRMSEETGLAVLLQNEAKNASWISSIYPFGITGEICKIKLLNDDKMDMYARKIHDDYTKQRFKEDIYKNNRNLIPWEKLNPDLKDSNRQQADHIMIKLRAIGCDFISQEQKTSIFNGFTVEEIQLMACMEHDRWVAERLLAGWTLGAKDTERRISPYLVDWNYLTDEIKEYDRESVRNIPVILSLAGEKIKRREIVK